MTKALHFSPGLTLPLEAVTQTFAFLARRGAGKTYGAGKLAEEMLGAGAQVVVLDPVGNWYGLRLAADGKGAGLDVPVFGGEHGDVPLEPTGGAVVARFIVETGTSVVLDVSSFRKGQRKQFCTDLAEELFHLKKSHRSPMHLFVEESQVFVPQRTMHGEERMLGAFEDIIKLGRNYGIGCTLISQRPQAVNKDALNQTECLVVLQINGAQERKALSEWMKEKDLDLSEMLGELPQLQRGEAFVWSPSWLQHFGKVKIGKKKTFDASATPEVGARVTAPKKLAPVDLDKIRDAMKDSIAKAEQDDPKALRRQVLELQKKLAAAPASTPAAPGKVKEVAVLRDAQLARLDKALERLDAWAGKLGEMLGPVRANLGEMTAALRVAVKPIPALKNAQLYSLARTDLQPARSRPAPKPRTAAAGGEMEGLSSSQQRVLDALAWFDLFGISQPSRAALAFIADTRPTSGGFKNNLGALRSAGLVDYPIDGRVALTDAGKAQAAPVDVQPTNGAMQDAACAAVTSSQAAILRTLIAEYPNALTREQLSEVVGVPVTSGGFKNNLGALRTLGLVAYPTAGEVAATDVLFPLGGSA